MAHFSVMLCPQLKPEKQGEHPEWQNRGTYEGADQDGAFEAYARDEGFETFKSLMAARGLSRDNFRGPEVK